MFSTSIFWGHSTLQASVLVQFPKPSKSIWTTIFNTLSLRSTIPWGSLAKWLTFAAENSAALAFLQIATQAPHPIQAAALKAFSAIWCGIRIEFALGACPMSTEMYPQEATILSKAERSTFKFFKIGNAEALKGSMLISSPDLKARK